MTALFISDLHLCEERPHTIELFHRFLVETAPTAQRLYILGDLFEYWAGDDAATAMHKKAAGWIKALTQQRTEVFFMPGNRDFLIGNQFNALCGWQPLTDPQIIQHQQQNVLLMHGDTLCTDDIDYMRFRKKYRHPLRMLLFRLLPVKTRKKLIHKYRGMSQGKDIRIMDVNEDTVREELLNYNARWLIHGHTHRPNTHHYDMEDGQQATRFVLADWDTEGQALRLGSEGFEIIAIT